MFNDIVPIDDYMFFDKERGKFCLTDLGSSILTSRGVICSYSGTDEWFHHFTLEMMNLYTGRGPFNHSFGDIDFHVEFPQAFNRDRDETIDWVVDSVSTKWGKQMYAMIHQVIDNVPNFIKLS